LTAEASALLITPSEMVNNTIGVFGILRFKTAAAAAPFVLSVRPEG
jgi:hypothetical protein